MINLRTITFIYILLWICSPVHGQVKQIPKEVRDYTVTDTVINLSFNKVFDRYDFEEWCRDNKYHIVKMEVSDISRFGKVLTTVESAKLMKEDIYVYLENLKVFRGEREVNCYSVTKNKPLIPAKDGFCYICFDGYIKQVEVKNKPSSGGWVIGFNTIEFYHKKVKVEMTGEFLNGKPNGQIITSRTYNGVEELHLFLTKNGIKNGKYYVFSNDRIPFMALSFNRNTMRERFYLYSYESKLLGAEPIYRGYGDFGLLVESDVRWRNFFKSLSPLLKCVIINEVVGSVDNSVAKGTLESVMSGLIGLDHVTLEAIIFNTSKHEAINQLRKGNNDAAELIEFVDFIYCVTSQF